MKNFIRTLIAQIRALPQPLSMDALASLLLPRSGYLNPTADSPEDINEHWFQLFSLTNELTKWNKLQLNTDGLPGISTEQEAVTRERKRNSARIRTLRDTLQTDNSELTKHYALVYNRYAQNRQASDALNCIANPVDIKGKLNLMRKCFKELSNSKNILQAEENQLSLHNFQVTQTETINQLAEQGVVLQQHSCLADLILQSEDQIRTLSALGESFPLMLASLSLVLSKEERLRQLEQLQSCKQLQSDIQDLKMEWSALSGQISSLALDTGVMTALDAEYDNPDTPDKNALLLNKQNALHSYIYIPGVVGYSSSSIEKKSLKYLQLRHQLLSINTAILEKELALSAMPDSSSPTLPDDRDLCDDAVKLLMSFDSTIQLVTTSPDALVQAIVGAIPRQQEYLEKQQHIQKLLLDLRQQGQDILTIRIEQIQMTDTENTAAAPERILVLNDTAMQRRDQLKLLNKQISSCQLAIKHLERLVAFDNEHSQLRKKNIELRSQLHAIKKAPPLTSPDETIKAVSEVIKGHVDTLLSLPLIHDEQSIILIDEEAAAESALAAKENETPVLSEVLLQWDLKIRPLLTRAAPEFSAWYQDLYTAMQRPESIEQPGLAQQKDQLLHDIHFELSYPGDNRVLAALQTMCPAPLADWQRLTTLKPPVSTETRSLDGLRHAPLRLQFTALYAHCDRLRPAHMREAFLLEQATRNLHNIALEAQDNRAHPGIEFLQQRVIDNRYDSLHQHRGGLCVLEWLARLCTSILSMFGAQEANAYRQRCFFARTASVVLVEEARHMVIKID